MKQGFIEDDEIYDPEEEIDEEIEDVTLDIFEDEEDDLEQISSYWNDRDDDYGKKKKSSRYSYDSDY